jgi:hypothetical protein
MIWMLYGWLLWEFRLGGGVQQQPDCARRVLPQHGGAGAAQDQRHGAEHQRPGRHHQQGRLRCLRPPRRPSDTTRYFATSPSHFQQLSALTLAMSASSLSALITDER